MQNRKKKIIGGVVAAFVVLGIGSAVAGGSDSPSAAKHSAVAKQPAKQAKGNDSASHPAAKTKPTASPTPDIQFTVEQRNAIHSAKEYLSMQGFSRQGLIDQLSSKYGDKYTVAQATYAANHVGL